MSQLDIIHYHYHTVSLSCYHYRDTLQDSVCTRSSPAASRTRLHTLCMACLTRVYSTTYSPRHGHTDLPHTVCTMSRPHLSTAPQSTPCTASMVRPDLHSPPCSSCTPLCPCWALCMTLSPHTVHSYMLCTALPHYCHDPARLLRRVCTSLRPQKSMYLIHTPCMLYCLRQTEIAQAGKRCTLLSPEKPHTAPWHILYSCLHL